MSKRPAPTLADYAVVAISPALIMTLIGSLIFFLIAVFYLGDYNGRLNFIMAMFVMGAVLIARIAIEQGRDYAMLFAIPLGIVTAIATIRFVEFSGPLKGVSSLINIGLIGLIWWCANKLTWDSTVIDEGKDASGVGLLQTVGLDANTSGNDAKQNQDGTTSRPAEPQLTLYQKFVQRRHRAHAPGVWVIYFSLAALPIFGFGNWFIPSSDLANRRYVFQLLVVYVASALGLLLATSFLGLRRYLRQRRLEMPTEIAAAWMGTGALMIVVLLVVCLILPRRNSEYSITQLPIFAGSPTDLWTTEHAVGNEGQEDPDKADREGEKPGGDGEPQKQGQGQTGDQQSPDGQQQSGDSNDKSDSQQKNEQQGGNSPREKQSPQSTSNDNRPNSKSDEQNQANDQQAENEKTGESKNPNEKTQLNQKNKSEDINSKGKSFSSEKSENTEGQSPPPPQQSDQSEPDQKKQQSQKNERRTSESRKQQRSTPKSSSRFDPSKLGSAFGGSIGQLMKLVYWLVVIAIVAFVAWRYHREIAEAIRNFMKSLRDLWESLFGGKRNVGAENEEAIAAPTGPPPKPFSSFADPFITGMAQQRPPAEVIRYSFEAFEAWGRERGYERAAEQTPHEYVQVVAQQQVALGREAAALAELYGRCAYGKEPANRSSFEHLRRLWEKLRA